LYVFPQGPVILTSPARIPLHIYTTSYNGFFLVHLAVNIKTVSPPEAADNIVLIETIDAILAASPVIDNVDPALKPNHPNHKIKVPITTKGILCGSKLI